MGVTLTSVGTIFISTSFSTVLMFFLIPKRPHLVVVGLTSAFYWTVAMMLTGAFWYAIPPLKQTYPWLLFLVVSFEELFRYLLYVSFKLMQKVDDGIEAFLRPGVLNEQLTGMAVGLGFAIPGVLVNYVSTLADNFMDNTAIYTYQCPHVNFFVASSAMTLAFSICQILWGTWVWSYYYKNNWGGHIGGFTVYLVHLGFAQLMNGNMQTNGCEWVLGSLYAITLALALLVAFICIRRVKKDSNIIA